MTEVNLVAIIHLNKQIVVVVTIVNVVDVVNANAIHSRQMTRRLSRYIHRLQEHQQLLQMLRQKLSKPELRLAHLYLPTITLNTRRHPNLYFVLQAPVS